MALIGLSGAGKSTVGRLVAERLGTTWVDLDARIEAESGKSIVEIMANEGETGFRAREAAALAAALETGAMVIACGGGIVMSPAARRWLSERCRVVWLEVTPGEAAGRLGAEASSRPLLAVKDPVARLGALLAEREAHYAALAGWRVPTSGRDPDTVAVAVVAALSSVPAPDGAAG